jgi:nitrite reductase/ring-hydroxylating ferredoxin subunit
MSELVKLCAESDVAEGKPVRVALEGLPIVAVFKVGADIFIIDDECTHGKASLVDDGAVEGNKVICGWHNCEFDLPSGLPYGFPCTEALNTYTPVVKDGAIYFDGVARPPVE